MNATHTSRMSFRLGFIRAMVLSSGLVNTLAGAALILAPEWFYNNVGYFPPFNRHYMGDAGTFTLPMGIALLFALRHPTRHRLLITAGMGVNLLHALNHVYDDFLTNQWSLAHWSGNTWSLLALAILGVVAVVLVWQDSEEDKRQVNAP